MKIRNAELCDLPYLLEMLENAKASLRALGIDQWQNGYPNENTLREDIQNKICRVVIDDENNILASAAVYVGTSRHTTKFITARGRQKTKSTASCTALWRQIMRRSAARHRF